MAFNAQLYTQARPDLQNNWASAHSPSADANDPVIQFIRQFPSYEAYAQNDFQNNPQAEQQQSAVHITPTNAVPAAQNAITNITNTPVQTAPPGGANGAGFSTLVNQNQPAIATTKPPETNVTVPAGGNYNQNQVGGQTGSFNTTGTTQQNTGQLSTQQLAQLVTSIQNQNQKTGNTNTGSQTSSGAQSTQGTNTGTTVSGGVTTNKPIDTLGFGDLLKGQSGQVGQNDTNRSAFLNDVMQTGGTGFESGVEQAVRNAQSGPGLTGAGDSARARSAGYAGAEAGRKNLDLRLNASQQLAGPTGLASLSTAANPYIGQQQQTAGTTKNVGTTAGTTANTGSSTNSSTGTGFSDLTGTSQQATQSAGSNASSGFNTTQDSTSGTAAGASSQSAAGQIPQAQQVSSGGGGCIICTAGLHHGLFRHPRILRRVVRYKLHTASSTFRSAASGYFLLFTPLARLALRYRAVARLTMPYARAVVYEELRISKWRVPFRVGPWFAHWSWHGVCSIAGDLFRCPGHVTSPEILNAAKTHNVLFTIPKEDSK